MLEKQNTENSELELDLNLNGETKSLNHEKLQEQNSKAQVNFDENNYNFSETYANKIIKSLESICIVLEEETESIKYNNFRNFNDISIRKITLLKEHEEIVSNIKAFGDLIANLPEEKRDEIRSLSDKFDKLAKQNQTELRASLDVANKVLSCFRDKVCELSQKSVSYLQNGTAPSAPSKPIAISTEI